MQLGYEPRPVADAGPGWSRLCYAHPAGRKAVFVGDLVDRGPRVVDSLSLVRNMVAAGHALCVPGNHDMKLMSQAPRQRRASGARVGPEPRGNRRPA